MPVYDYECDECKNRFEVRQRFVEDPVSVCPSCGGRVRRVYHPVGIVFKGSGFYVTDNRKSGESSSATPASGTSDSKSADSKPAESKPAESKASDSKSSPSASGGSTESKSKGSTSGSTAGSSGITG